MARWRSAMRRAAWVARRAVVALGVSVIGVAIWVVAVPFPEGALEPHAVTSTIIVDRHGRPLREVLSEREGRGRWVGLDAISPHLVAATIHAEDKRFFDHSGVDGLAIARSLWINIAAGRPRTGASTLTQQTVKMTVQREAPRTLGTKLMEAVWALRLELARDKDAILEQYLNRAPYGNQLFGAEAASWMYFGKPAAALSLAEAALLAGVPQTPTHQNPYRDLDRAVARQRAILAAMHERGAITEAERRRAEEEPLRLLPRRATRHAPHLTDRLAASLARTPGPRPGVVQTTLDLALQERVEAILAHQLTGIAPSDRSQAAAIVLDTDSGEVLAWVGSRDVADAAALGANDGVLALRQPGSALKPFLYGAWLDATGSAAELIADLPTEFTTPDGVYRPQNFDRRFHGPVTMREALASSLNVPAVLVAERLGVDALHATLTRFGLGSLTQPTEHYGLGLALGNGEVRLVDLAGAYAALGRLGRWRPVRWLAAEGDEALAEPTRVMSEAAAFTMLEMLTDDRARGMGFGHAGPLALPYRIAAKTGTSSDFRDNWAVAVTPDYTIGVWVGNFDGRPMNRLSGPVGAAPTLRQIAQALYPRAAGPADVRWYTPPAGLASARLCRINGRIASARCERSFTEWLTPEALEAVGRGGDGYEIVRLDRATGLLAGPGCGEAEVEERAFARLPARWREWAAAQRFAVAPDAWSPRCPGDEVALRAATTRLVHPNEGARFRVDPGQPRGVQLLTLRAESDSGAPVTFFINGTPVATVGPPFRASWPLEPGEWEIAVGRDLPGDSVRISVR